MAVVPGRGGGEAVRIRDHLANTRTLLSWFRTGVILLAMGFAVQKFDALASYRITASPLGPVVAALGLLVMAASLGRFLHQRHQIEQSEFRPQTAFGVVLVASVGAIGVAVLYLVAK